MDYNARYYSPVLGRFVSPDSIVPEPTSSSGFNRYRYVRNNPLRYTDPSGHYTVDPDTGECFGGDCDDFWGGPPPDNEGEDNEVLQPPLQESKRVWDWIPDGGRLDLSGWIPAIFVLGGDVNIDFVSANFDPNETSIIIGVSPIVGTGQGGAVTGGLIWHDAKDIEEYKMISNNLAFTAVPGGGVEVNGAFSGATGAKLLNVAIGGGGEFSGAYGKQLVTLDTFQGNLTLGGEVVNIQFDLW